MLVCLEGEGKVSFKIIKMTNVTPTPLESEVRRTSFGFAVPLPTDEYTLSRIAVRILSDSPPGQFRIISTKVVDNLVNLHQLFCYRVSEDILKWYAYDTSQVWRKKVGDDFVFMYDDTHLEFKALEALLQTSTQQSQ